MKIHVPDLDPVIASDIREFQRDNPREAQGDDLELSVAIDQFLKWNGVIGYTSAIMTIIDEAQTGKWS